MSRVGNPTLILFAGCNGASKSTLPSPTSLSLIPRDASLLGAFAISVLPGFGDKPLAGCQAHAANPILPGYYADPSIVSHGGSHFIYATLDPWGGETLGCWESSDFKQ